MIRILVTRTAGVDFVIQIPLAELYPVTSEKNSVIIALTQSFSHENQAYSAFRDQGNQ